MRRLTVFFICMFALTVGFAAEDDLSIEALLPAGTSVFVKTEPIADFIVSAKNFISLFNKKSSAGITEKIDSFKSKTGIDPLNEDALRNIGLDTKRRAALAVLRDSEPLVFLPVSNGETFGRAFVEIMLKMDDSKKRDLYPAITSYKNFKVSQIEKDIFAAAVNDFFVITNSGEKIHSIIDMSFRNKSAALSQDSDYLSYLKQRNNNVKTIHAFARGEAVLNDGMVLKSGHGKITSSVGFYLAGASIEKSKLLFQLGVSFNKDNPEVNALLNLFSAQSTNLALYDSDSLIYVFLSLNLNSLDTLPDEPSFEKAKGFYRMLCDFIKESYGIDFKEDFSMYSKGVFNSMIGDIIKKENVIFMPMTDASKSLALSRKIQEHLKKKYEPRNLFGYENVGSFGKAAYYFDDAGVKNYVYSDQRGFYVATSISLLNAAAKKPYIEAAGKPFAMKINDNMWSFTVIKMDALRPMLVSLLGAGRNADFNDFINRLGNIYMSCSKNDSFVSVDTEILIGK